MSEEYVKNLSKKLVGIQSTLYNLDWDVERMKKILKKWKKSKDTSGARWYLYPHELEKSSDKDEQKKIKLDEESYNVTVRV